VNEIRIYDLTTMDHIHSIEIDTEWHKSKLLINDNILMLSDGCTAERIVPQT
jgi:hypothetical protein